MSEAKKLFLAALLCILVGVGVSFADGDTGSGVTVQPQAVAVGYLPTTATGAYRSTLSAGDNSDLGNAAVAAVQTLSCGGKTTVAVTGTFSVSGATSLIEIVRYRGSEIRGYSQTTLTAVTTVPTTGGRYPSQTVYFDTGNADYVKILLRGAPSSGNVTLMVDAY